MRGPTGVFVSLALGVLLASSSARADVRYDPADSPWFLALSAGVPSLESGNLSAVGSAEVGLQLERFGVEAAGELSAYDFDDERRTAENQSARGGAEAWWLSGGPGDSARFELRFAGGGAYYDSTYIGKQPVTFDDETSWMGRGSLLAGLVLEPDQYFYLEMILGGGGQYESYNALSTTSTNLIDDSDSFTFQGRGRTRLRWSFLPDTLSARVWLEASYFRLRRSTFIFGQDATTAVVGVEELTQVDVGARLFIDIDAVAFYGIVPAVFGGFDYVSLSGDSGDVTTFVPMGGVSIIRPF